MSPLDQLTGPSAFSQIDLLALDDAISTLESANPEAARVVKFRFFAGLSIPKVAEAMGISPRSAERLWTYARIWLHRELEEPAR
jgi:hypothetical protein